jgi:protein involved in temperature-dependent protein secretion
MSTIDEFTTAVRQSDERIAGLREAILANGERPLLEGTWRVRDALSHLAARSNGVPRMLTRLEALDSGAAPPAIGSVDEINAGQVADRSDRTMEELLDEITAGHQAAIEAAAQFDAATLERRIPLGFRPGDATVGELLVMGGPRHENGHLDQIEAALKA